MPGLSFCEEKEAPGILQSFEQLINLNKNQYVISKQKKDFEVKSLQDQGTIADIVIDPFFMKTMLFRSEKKYLKLLKETDCSLAALLSNNLLHAFERPLQNLLVQIKNENGKNKTLMVNKDEFLAELYKRKCSTNKELDILYSSKNIKKTIEGIELKVPKTKNSCKEIFNKWINDINTPYLCRVPETIEDAKRATEELKKEVSINFPRTRYLRGIISQAKLYQEQLPLFKRSYLENLCNGLEKVENFCSEYLAEDAWTKVLNGELPKAYLSYKCKNILKEETPKIKDLEKCAQMFNKEPETCLTKGNKGFPSFYPLRKCDQLSEVLNIAKLKTNYHDCPGRVDNEAVVNIHRIIMHMKREKLQSTPLSCMNETHQTFARLAMNYNKEEIWPLKICYFDPAREVEACDSYIPGNNFKSPDAENMVMASILKRTKGAPDKMKCLLTPSNEYNPLRLKYQVGCFIVFDPHKCTSSYCPKRIFWGKTEVKGIRYQGVPRFSYFPASLKEAGNSVERILERTLKIRNKSLKNLTEIVYFFDAKEDNIIHGVGCVEDILPETYSKDYFNGCRPIPFILDGYKKMDGDTFFSVRLPIDDIHTPRLLNWNKVFNSINNYKKIHPTDPWTLNGIVKNN